MKTKPVARSCGNTVLKNTVILVAVLAFFMFGFSAVLAGGNLKENGDIGLYFDSGSRLLAGEPLREDFKYVYPLPALFYFAIPALLTTSVYGYAILFAGMQLCVLLAAFYFVYAYAIRLKLVANEALVKYAVLTFLLAPLALGRYDLLPATVAFAAVYFFEKKSYGLSFACIAIGTALKFYPALLLPIFGIAYLQKKRRLREIAIDAAPALAVVLIYAAISVMVPHSGSFVDSAAFHVWRLPEIESTYSSALLAFNAVQPIGIQVDYSYYSLVVRFPFENEVAIASLAVMAAVLAAVYFAAYRSRRKLNGVVLAAYCLLALLAFMLTSKVFSPQYMLWIAPFIAVLAIGSEREGKLVFALYAVAVLLTVAVYPYLFPDLILMKHYAIAILVARNAALAALSVHLFVRLWRQAR